MLRLLKEDKNFFMQLEVGSILEGKVTGITKFGAFVEVAPGTTGMVHISEVANAYVSDIRQYLTEGQEVKVMIIALDPAGKINLSMKRLEPKQAVSSRQRGGNDRPRAARQGNARTGTPTPTQATVAKSSDQIFEERLKQFMSESDSKISSLRQYTDHRTKNRRR